MKRTTLLHSLYLSLAGLVLSLFVSCTPYQQQGAAIGALGGAGLGAIVGGDTNDIITGAALGGATGAGVTAYQEEQQRRSNQSYNSTRTYRQPQTNTPSTRSYTPPTSNTYPPTQRPSYQTPPSTTLPRSTARTTNGKIPLATPGMEINTVISPYPPYNVLSTEGASSGDKLCDPSTIPNDPATGRPYLNSKGQPDVKRGSYFIVP